MSAAPNAVTCPDCLTAFDFHDGQCPTCWHRVCPSCARIAGDRATLPCRAPTCADDPDADAD